MSKHPYDIKDELDAIRLAIQRIASFLRKTPTQQEYKRERRPDEPSYEQITYRLGTWSAAVESAGLQPNPINTPPRKILITKEQLVHEFIAVANKIGGIPSMRQFRVHSHFSWRPYLDLWGTWQNTAKDIAENNRNAFSFKTQELEKKKKKIPHRKHLALSLPLLYEPQNEYETIALFCLLAKELGFRIKSIQSDFPDAILVKDEAEILVEFEYLSSNYMMHGHPLSFNGIVICWRKDIDLENIQIISLEEYIRNKPVVPQQELSALS